MSVYIESLNREIAKANACIDEINEDIVGYGCLEPKNLRVYYNEDEISYPGLSNHTTYNKFAGLLVDILIDNCNERKKVYKGVIRGLENTVEEYESLSFYEQVKKDLRHFFKFHTREQYSVSCEGDNHIIFNTNNPNCKYRSVFIVIDDCGNVNQLLSTNIKSPGIYPILKGRVPSATVNDEDFYKIDTVVTYRYEQFMPVDDFISIFNV